MRIYGACALTDDTSALKMNLSDCNILKQKNCNNELNKVPIMSCGKRRRSDDDDRKRHSNNTKNAKRWSFSIKGKDINDLNEMGVGLLNSDDNCDSPLSVNSDCAADSNEDCGVGLSPNPIDDCNEHPVLNSTEEAGSQTDSESNRPKSATSDLDESIPSCSYASCEDDAQKNVVKEINSSEIEDYYIVKKRFVYDVGPDLINKLSDEIILQIFKWLSKPALLRCSLVSKRMCRLARDESLWTRLDLSNRSLFQGAFGQILSRQVVFLRMAQTELEEPAIMPSAKAFRDNFECKLQYLDLSMAVVSLDTLEMLFKRCKLLKKISLENLPLSENICKYISQNEDLETVNMTMCQGLNLKAMEYLLTGCRKIRELNLGWTLLNGETLNFVCTHLPVSVLRLNISGCRKTLFDRNIENLVHCCPHLKELDISDCTSLTVETVDLVLHLKDLTFLAMSRCYAVSPPGFKRLKTLPSLQYFDCHGHMIETALKQLKEYFGERITVNQFLFSSIARPTVGVKRTSIWNYRVRD